MSLYQSIDDAARYVYTTDHKYKELALEYERNIELVHPTVVTSCGEGWCPMYHCDWHATRVKYYEFQQS